MKEVRTIGRSRQSLPSTDQTVAGRMFGLPIDSTLLLGTTRRMYRSLETYRGVVYPWVMDHMGHMNVASYTARFDEATWHFLAKLGLTPGFQKRSGRGAVAADQKTQYKREVMAGTLLHITTELQDVGRKSIRFVHHMYDSENNEEVATTELVGVYFDTAARSSVEWPEMVREHAQALLIPSDPSHPERSEGSAVRVRTADPSLCSG